MIKRYQVHMALGGLISYQAWLNYKNQSRRLIKMLFDIGYIIFLNKVIKGVSEKCISDL